MSLLPIENSPDDLFSFSGSVGRFGDNNRDDVIKAQALLANAGYYELPAPGMPTGWPGGELNNALTRFQKDHGPIPTARCCRSVASVWRRMASAKQRRP
jgi:hypothetical protein